MNFRHVAALAGFAAASQLLQAAPAMATSIATDRHSTDLVAQLLGDAKLARLALIRNDTAMATKDIDGAVAARAKLVQIADVNGKSTVVQIYTELDENAALSSNFTAPERVPNQTRAGHIKALETTYFAIDLDKARTRLDAAQRAVRNNDNHSAEASLAAIRSDLVRGNNAVDVPLLAARRELALAQGAIRSDRIGPASADLKDASGSLESYSSVGHSAAAHQLAADIQASMRIHSQSASSMSTKIDGWWASVKAWFSHA